MNHDIFKVGSKFSDDLNKIRENHKPEEVPQHKVKMREPVNIQETPLAPDVSKEIESVNESFTPSLNEELLECIDQVRLDIKDPKNVMKTRSSVIEEAFVKNSSQKIRFDQKAKRLFFQLVDSDDLLNKYRN